MPRSAAAGLSATPIVTAPKLLAWCNAATVNVAGSKLLDLIINEQLQGSYTRSYTEGGMEIEIILPRQQFSDLSSKLLAHPNQQTQNETSNRTC